MGAVLIVNATAGSTLPRTIISLGSLHFKKSILSLALGSLSEKHVHFTESTTSSQRKIEELNTAATI